MCVYAIRTILELTLVTHGHLLSVRLGATKGTNNPIVTHNILIIIVLLCKCGPHMCKYMFPHNTGSRPYVPGDVPMPHACKQMPKIKIRVPISQRMFKKREANDDAFNINAYPPPPCISYANVHNYYGPYADYSLEKGVACARHIQLPTHTCAGHMC